MSDSFNPPNSVWPNGLKKDNEGYVVFYPLGTNKVDVPTSVSEWPKGDKLVSPFVYQDDKLVGFVDTKALTTDEPKTIYLPYEHIEAEFSSIKKGDLSIHAPKATTKTTKWSDSGSETIGEASFKYKGCKTVDEVKAVDSSYTTSDIVDDVWSQPLWDLEEGGKDSHQTGLFSYTYCENLTTFNSDLPSLVNGPYMFYGIFLTSFNGDLSSLTNGYYMFGFCENLTSFTSDLSSLTNGYRMFYKCTNLTSFASDLSSLTNGVEMFKNCKLDTTSVQRIADTINTITDIISIHIDIGNSTPNEQEDAAFNKIVSKGWAVYVNGSQYTPTAPAAIITLDETGQEISTPIPFYAKPVEAAEETASYIDANGNFFNILGGQFIYGDDLSTYGMFTCEEDAAANMRLTPYTKPQTEIENQ